MFGRQNLGTIGMNFSIAHPDFVDAIHQLRDQIKTKAGRAEGGDLLLGREDHLRVFDRVLEIVFLHCRGAI